METSSSSALPHTTPSCSLSYADYLNLLFLRPIIALAFVFSLLLFGWYLAWKLVLVHVPLVQEIFGLRKKPVIPKPPTRGRLTQFYNTINALDSTASWAKAPLFQVKDLPASLLIEKIRVWIEKLQQKMRRT